MDTRVAHELLLVCDVEERPVRDARLVGGASRVAWPGVQVRIKVDHRHWAVDLVQGS